MKVDLRGGVDSSETLVATDIHSVTSGAKIDTNVVRIIRAIDAAEAKSMISPWYLDLFSPTIITTTVPAGCPSSKPPFPSRSSHPTPLRCLPTRTTMSPMSPPPVVAL
ncbi:hypothetical protein FVER14953_20008 [Fusarium verticillioides]|nr:hypothetical protein FVER14953_20008 [Fusarium verticillioides]